MSSFTSYYANLSPEKRAVIIARAAARNRANPERRREICRLSARRRRAAMDPVVRRALSRAASAARQKDVCGLHVETNLQVITRTENRSKGARHGATR